MLFHLGYLLLLVQVKCWNLRSESSTTETAARNTPDDLSCDDVRASPRVAWAIMGGSQVRDQTTVPYIAALGQRAKDGKTQWFCGGVLLSDKLVVTAAHCLIKKADLVRLGGTSLNANASSQDVAVDSVVVHPEYRSPHSYHDIALLRLATRVDTSNDVRPICLAGKDAGRQTGEVTTVMGWGAETVAGNGNTELRKVEVNIFDSAECDRVYTNSQVANMSFPKGITDQQLCAGGPHGGKDSCKGDSGGPLVVQDRNQVIRLLGIVTGGIGCGVKDVPGVYLRVSSYQTWINRYI